MPIEITCQQCGQKKSLRPALAKVQKFCSTGCKAAWQSQHRSGENHPQWQGGKRKKRCQQCGEEFEQKPGRAHSLFKKQKFCTKACADIGGHRHTGPDNSKWKEGPVKRSGSSQQRFRRLIIERDGATCRECGSTENLQAHHVRPIKEAPELRWDVGNGIMLCQTCHLDLHNMKIG